MKVSVDVSKDRIEAVRVDAVTGATMTSEAVMAAVTETLKKAGAEAVFFEAAKKSDKVKSPIDKTAIPESADVVIVGAAARSSFSKRWR